MSGSFGPKVEEELAPPPQDRKLGEPWTPTRPMPEVSREKNPRGRTTLDWWLLFLEYVVYVIVLLMVGVAIWVNLWVAYFHAAPDVLTRFTSDAEFSLAAGAVLLIAFEFRKERAKHEDQSNKRGDSSSARE